ncbi:hypothetical protein Tco_0510491, partial [Tanacetum coccineum]
MAGLDFCPKHNMVAYLEKNEANTEFHQIMDFLTRSSIHFALTISPIVSTLFVEQFWTTAKSRTVNNMSYIDATVAGKPVTISEASIRSDLLFNDADGIDTLNNQAIFDTIQLMGGLRVLVLNRHPESPIPITFSTHTSEDQPESQPLTFFLTTFLLPIPIPDSNLEGSGGNHGGQSSSDRSLSGNEDGLTLQSVYDLCVSLCKQVTAQAAEIKDLKAQIKQLKKKAKPVINHHKSCLGLLGRENSSQSSKGAPSVQTHTDWDGLDTNLEASLNEAMDYTLAQEEGKTDSKVEEPKTSSKTEELHLLVDEMGESTAQQQSTDKPNESTDKQDEGTDRTKQSIDKQVEGTTDVKDEDSRKSASSTTPTITSTTTPTIFGDDKTITQVLVTMSQSNRRKKEKGAELRNVKDIERPRPTSTRYVLTLKPLAKIDPKDKGKKRIEEDESDTESEDINEAKKKFKILAHNEEIARNVQEEWEAEEEKKRLAEEEATKATLTNEYDFIQARHNADKILAKKLQEEEREMYTIEYRAKFLHGTIAAQRRFLAQQ